MSKKQFGKKRASKGMGTDEAWRARARSKNSPSHPEHKPSLAHRLAVAFRRGIESFRDEMSYGAWEQGRTDSQWRDTSARERAAREDARLDAGEPLNWDEGHERSRETSYLFEHNGFTYRIGDAA